MPTRSSASAAVCSASLRPIPKCVSSASRICRPIVRTGFSEVIGSWKIIAISLPRTERRARSLCRTRSRPWKTALPDSIRPFRDNRPRIDSDVTLLPQPDSPTMPSVSPGAMSKLMPLTAYTVPRRVQKRTCMSSTESRGCLLATRPQLPIERLAQPIPDQVEAEHGEDDRKTGDDREERRDRQVLVHVRQHRPPLRRRRVLRTEAEEAEPRNVDDRRGHCERRGDDHDGHRVGHDVRDEDDAAAHADRPRSEHEIVLPLREDRA